MRWRRPTMALLAVAGLAVAGCTATPGASGDTSPTPTGAAAPTAPPERVAPPAPPTALAWVPGGLPDGFVGRVLALPDVRSVTVVLGDTVPLGRTVPGYTVPVEAIALDCTSWSTFEPVHGATLCGLDEDEALLGATSAALRDAAVGDILELGNGHRITVAGVVPDDAVGAAELVVPVAGADAAGIRVARYVLVEHEGDHDAVETAIRAVAPGVLLRVRAPGDVAWFRHADGVLPQAMVKERFGEFGSRPAGAGLELDPGWRDANLVTVQLPVVGQVTCHRGVVPALRGALEEIAGAGLVAQVDRAASGCWNPRPIAGTDQPSRHAWGVALDIVPAPADGRVVEVFRRWGFTWGGEWLTPDPIHFEYVRPPTRSPAGPAAR